MNQFITFAILIKGVLSFYVKGSYGKYVEGHLIVAEKWYFVARFCFLSEHGQFEYFVEYSKEYGVQNLLLYYDSDDQWPAVYKTPTTCEEKEALLNINQNQIINLTETEFGSGCTILKTRPGTKNAIVACHNARRFHSARPRWWFLAISNCNATNGLNLKYKFLMTNGYPGELWKEHFSADEFYILPLLTVFFVMYIILLVATFGCSVELKSRQLLHSTYKLFTFSVVLQEVGITLQCIAYMRYAFNGIGLPNVRTLGRMLESASEICFLLLLLLMAKGYTITRGRLRLASSVKLTIFMCAYVATTIALFIYEQKVFDPGEVLYLYESPAGFGLMILRIAAWWIFEYSTCFTLRHYPEKSNFYYPFNLMGTLWFVAGPGFTITANTFIDKWIRESVVCAIYHLIAFCGHVLFFLLTIPSKANKNFPYHVRTSQIGVMEMTGIVGNSNLHGFGHHPYEPYPVPLSLIEPDGTRIRSPDVPVDLFSIRHASPQFLKAVDCINSAENEDRELPVRNLKSDILNEPVRKGTTSRQNSPPQDETVADQPTTTSVPAAELAEPAITDDRFIAPSLRNSRTPSAQSEKPAQ